MFFWVYGFSGRAQIRPMADERVITHACNCFYKCLGFCFHNFNSFNESFVSFFSLFNFQKMAVVFYLFKFYQKVYTFTKNGQHINFWWGNNKKCSLWLQLLRFWKYWKEFLTGDKNKTAANAWSHTHTHQSKMFSDVH